MKTNRILFIIILFFISSINSKAQNIVDKTGLKQGEYQVGFNLTEYKDYSRTSITNSPLKQISSEEKARTVRMYMWYPAKLNNEKPNTLKDFFIQSLEDFGPINDKSKLDELVYFSPQFNRIPKSKIDKLLAQECISVNAAERAEGQFPVILLGQGYYYELPISHLILCEYLASHGYIVVTCPLFGTYSKAVELNMVDFETQVKDLEFILSKVFEYPGVDPERIAALGFDLGAMSATLLQMRNTNIKALVCYDGGIMFEHNTSRLLNPSPYYDPEKLNVPAMIFTRTIENNKAMGLKEDSTIFLSSPYSRKFIVRTENMKHKFYTSYPSLGVESIASPQLALNAYPIICDYTLNFFNYFLKNDQRGLQFINDDPSRFDEKEVKVSVEELSSKPIPLNPKLLESVILNYGFEEGARIYKMAKNKNEVISEDELNAIAYLLLYNYARATDAISMFKFIIEEYPQSANAYDSLGEAYLFIWDYKSALLNYKKSLELNPENENAKRIISQLEKVLQN